MALTLKIGDLDLSDELRVAHDQGMDPGGPDYLEPQFVGSSALGEGEEWVGDAVTNRRHVYPLILNEDDSDAVYARVREINRALVKGAVVEFRSSTAAESTFFDLKAGKLAPKYEHWLDSGGNVRAELVLWTLPFGHAGTNYVIATAATAGNALVALGTGPEDADAGWQLGIKVKQPPPGFHRNFAFGIKRAAPSGWQAVFSASQIAGQQADDFSGTWTVRGASGRTASRYAARVASSADLAQGQLFLSLPPNQYAGRYRVLMSAQILANSIPASASAYMGAHHYTEEGGKRISRFKLETHKTMDWYTYDLGEIDVPSGRPPTRLHVSWSAPSMSRANASSYFNVDSICLLPVDTAAGVVRALPNSSYLSGSRSASGFTVDVSAPSGQVTLTSVATWINGTHSMPPGSVVADLTRLFAGKFPTVDELADLQLVVYPLSGNETVGDYPLHGMWGHAPIEITVEARPRFRYLR